MKESAIGKKDSLFNIYKLSFLPIARLGYKEYYI